MGELLNLSVYNPSSLSDEDFLRCFVARQMVANRLIDRLRDVKRGGLATHQLLMGQRGMGKTSMLRRLAIAVDQDPVLNATFIPLSFREEQYNVHSLSVFWSNCLDALADWCDRTGRQKQARAIDEDVARLNLTDKTAAHELFKKWIAAENKRPLLLLDNIDLIFGGLKNEQWNLRKHFQEPGGIVVVGGTATYMEATADREAAFYDFFQVTKLDKLSKEELIACLRSLALARGHDGEKVVRLVDQEPARIRTIHDLTGGNPRTLTLLYMLLEIDTSGDVFSDLERLLDQVTVLYKARVEDLPNQARVVLDAVALAWNPVLAAEVADTTALDVSTVSSQMDRLQKEGVVEKVSVSKTSKSAYQISERFFNIWYLMRHGPRRQRTRLRWLTGFLKSFYSPAQLLERAKSLVNGSSNVDADQGQMLIALSEAIDDEDWRSLLKNHVREHLERFAASIGKTLDEIVDPSELPRPITAWDWNRHGLLLRQHLKRSREAEDAYKTAISIDPSSWDAWFNLGTVRMADLADIGGAVQAYRMAVSLKPNDVSSQFWLASALAQDPATHGEAEKYFQELLKQKPSFYPAALALGDLLTEQAGRLPEAEKAFALASRSGAKKGSEALHGAAFFAGFVLEQFERAARLYQRQLTIDPDDFVARSNLVILSLYVRGDRKPEVNAEFLRAHPLHGRAVMEAIVALLNDRFVPEVHLPGVFEGDGIDLIDTYRGFLYLLLREVRRRGFGVAMLNWLDVSGTGDRQWPVRAAFDAYVNGENKLLDINPEVRTAAQKIHSLLTAPERYVESMGRPGDSGVDSDE